MVSSTPATLLGELTETSHQDQAGGCTTGQRDDEKQDGQQAQDRVGVLIQTSFVPSAVRRRRHWLDVGPLIGGKLVLATQIEAARQMVLHAAALRDAGTPALQAASMAKLFASEMAERVCSDAIQTFGGYGYTRDFPVERIYRDVRVCQIYEGTSDVQRLVIARGLASA